MEAKNNLIKLSEVPMDNTVIVKEIICQGLARRRMMDLGIVQEAKIYVNRKSPLGDPRSYVIRGAEIALREEEGSQILVEKL